MTIVAADRNWNHQTPLNAIALSGRRAMEVMHRFDLDYCCRGSRSLGEACLDKGLAADQVLAALVLSAEVDEHDEPEPAWETEPLSRLTQHIVSTHHLFTRRTLEEIQSLAPKVLAKHGARHHLLHELVQVIDALEADLLPHMRKEENILFPYVTTLEQAELAGTPVPIVGAPLFSDIRDPIAFMISEHEGVGFLLSRVVTITHDFAPVDGACTKFRALYSDLANLRRDLMMHIALENNVLFPRAVELERRVLTQRARALTQVDSVLVDPPSTAGS